MLKIEKLSEKNLIHCIKELFPNTKIAGQKRIKIGVKTLIVDYEVITNSNKQILIEFDGPTHFCNTSTQIRDQMLEKYCETNNIDLIRIPYFVQLNDDSISNLFHNFYDEFEMEGKIVSTYKTGFWDLEGVIPGDFNHRGMEIFLDFIADMVGMHQPYEFHNLVESLQGRSGVEFFGVRQTEEVGEMVETFEFHQHLIDEEYEILEAYETVFFNEFA